METNKEKTAELLKYISRNAKMGGDNLDTVISGIEDSTLKKTLSSQKNEYRCVERQAKAKLEAAGQEAPEAGFTAACTRMMVNMKTMMDRSAEHIAEMVLQGSTMGIIDITKQLKNADGCDEDAVNLAYRLKCIEQKNLDEMKHYL